MQTRLVNVTTGANDTTPLQASYDFSVPFKDTQNLSLRIIEFAV